MGREQTQKGVDTSRIVVKEIPVGDIEDHPENPNRHSPSQIEQLAASHSELGQYKTILVWARPNNKYIRVTGHGYSAGATDAGAQTLRVEVLPEDTPPLLVKAIMLADNLHGRNSTPDDGLLTRLLQEQEQTALVSLAALGTDEETFQALLTSLQEPTFPFDLDEEEDDSEEEDEEEEDDLLPLTSERLEQSQAIPRLTFGRYRIPLTEEELAGLQLRVEAYTLETGSYNGFARSLLHV